MVRPLPDPESHSPVLTIHGLVAERSVQVPEMAESISEGTLKQFSKSVGDYVEQDEEIATIETDKIDVAVNAPEAGTIKEFLVKEEDTVAVGQDILKMDAGAPPPEQGAKKQEKPEPEESPSQSERKSAPQPRERTEPKQVSQESKPEPSEQQPKPSAPPPKQPEQKPKDGAKPVDPNPSESSQGLGGREERRVCLLPPGIPICNRTDHGLGQNEQNASTHC